jgi:hypothetical protein
VRSPRQGKLANFSPYILVHRINPAQYTIATGERVNLVPIVEEPKDPQTDFHGFFLENLPRRCWITTGQDDKVYLVTHTEWRSRRVSQYHIYILDFLPLICTLSC